MNSSPASESEKGSILLTIFLRHDQSKPLDEINKGLRQQGYYRDFPPPGIELFSWYVMMGIGQVVTLQVPAERLREVNVAIEKTAWGGIPHGVLSNIRLESNRGGAARQEPIAGVSP